MFNSVPVFASIILETFFTHLYKGKRDVKICLAVVLWLFCLLPGNSLLGQNCQSEGYNQFDFWAGKWDVYRPGTEILLGRNHIKKIAKGCAILENWTGKSGFKGQSLNTYDAATDKWRQRWVDQSGQVIDFTGIADEKGMIFRAVTMKDRDSLYHRMTYRFNSSTEEVTQTWMQKRSGKGKDWSTIFQGQYKKTEK